MTFKHFQRYNEESWASLGLFYTSHAAKKLMTRINFDD